MFKLRSHGDVVQHGVISFLGFSGRDVSDRLDQPTVVEPVDPFERGIFDNFKGSPWTSPVDHLGLVKAIDRLRQGVVITVANTPNRRLDPGLGEALGIFDRHILAAAIAVVDQPTTMGRSAIVDGLLECVQDEARMRQLLTRQPTI